MSTFPASFSAERNFLTAGQLLDSSCSGSAAIDSPVGAIPCNLPVTGEGTFNTTSPRKGLQWTARIDHHLNDSKDRIYGAINRTTVDKVLFGTPDVYPDFNTISPTNSLHFNTNWTRIVSPTHGERGVVLVRARLRQPAAEPPGCARHPGHRHRAVSDDVGSERLRAEQLRVARRPELDAQRPQPENRRWIHGANTPTTKARASSIVRSTRSPASSTSRQTQPSRQDNLAIDPTHRRGGRRTSCASTARTRSRRSSRTTGSSGRTSRSVWACATKAIPTFATRRAT